MSTDCKSRATFLVFALRPCSVLGEAIRQAKIKTQAIAGDQTYVSHPPHLTLYVSAFEDPVATEFACRELIANWQIPDLDITGWHSFQGDVLTGNTTLVCNIAESSRAQLRSYQNEIIQNLSVMRNRELSSQRYFGNFQTLSPNRQKAVEEFGFPFVSNDWIPHLTIASIHADRWEYVWDALGDHPPKGQFHCDNLIIFELKEDEPHLWREMPLLGRS